MSDVGHVLIVGGGIAGLTLAAALHRCGVSAEVVERDADWHAAGAGLSVQPNGLRVLGQLGLGTAVIQNYLACLDDDEQIHCSAIEWVEQMRWHTGRTVLIGDAAHASSPMMGQGGSLAMEDALVLAELLRDAQTVEQALARYARRRAPRVHWVQQQSLAVAESFNMPTQARKDILRRRGEAIFRNRYAPLAAQP